MHIDRLHLSDEAMAPMNPIELMRLALHLYFRSLRSPPSRVNTHVVVYQVQLERTVFRERKLNILGNPPRIKYYSHSRKLRGVREPVAPFALVEFGQLA